MSSAINDKEDINMDGYRIVVQLYCSDNGYKWQILDNDNSVIKEGYGSSTSDAFIDAYCYCKDVDIVY